VDRGNTLGRQVRNTGEIIGHPLRHCDNAIGPGIDEARDPAKGRLSLSLKGKIGLMGHNDRD
jgi:hypothetical protein